MISEPTPREQPAGAPPPRKRFLVGVTGASGALYACRLIEALLIDPAHEVQLIVSPAGQRVLAGELAPMRAAAEGGAPLIHSLPPGPQTPDKLRAARTGLDKSPLLNFLNLREDQIARLHAHSFGDIGAGPASGTFRVEAMIVIPCSMNTLGAIAHGLAGNLLVRAASVTLKEGRPLILVPRETPLTLIDLRNMMAAAEAGAVILPANPGFYHRPATMEDLIRYVVQKILDRLGVAVVNPIRWGEPAPES